jgi:hypothetical protein
MVNMRLLWEWFLAVETDALLYIQQDRPKRVEAGGRCPIDQTSRSLGAERCFTDPNRGQITEVGTNDRFHMALCSYASTSWMTFP